MKVYQVSQVCVVKVSESPLVLSIRADGLAATSGWTNPRLDNSADPNPDDAVLEFSFEADRPSVPSLQVLTPIIASVDFTPTNGADAVIISARTNSITVHATDFITSGLPRPPVTTLALGEEGPPVTTLALGEEGPQPTTRALGEEDPQPTTLALGEEGPQPTTRALGEEGPQPTTLAIGEEGSPFGWF